MNEQEMRAVFLLAGIEIENVYKLANNYWPDVPAYADIRRDNPWWLVKTNMGLIQIGNRKRVTSISWEDTIIEYPLQDQFGRDNSGDIHVTMDDVTKDAQMVHAYTYGKCVDYLSKLKCDFERAVYLKDFHERAEKGELTEQEKADIDYWEEDRRKKAEAASMAYAAREAKEASQQ